MEKMEGLFMTINEIIKNGIINLKEKNIEEPLLKIRLLVASVLNKTKEYVMAHSEDELDEIHEKKILEGIEQLRNYIPIQYITNNQEFMKLNFFVNQNVLIPRSDTEILVEEVINTYKNEHVKILDMCTGSGCIAISLKKYMQNSEVYGIDISKEALKVAQINAKNNNVDVKFKCSDMFADIQNKDFDVIVSNPPYIKTQVINTLDKEVKNEPIIALDGGEDGLYFYKKIINEAFNFLADNGMLFLEIGFDQKEELEKLIKADTRYELVKTKKDLGDNDRIVVVKKV